MTAKFDRAALKRWRQSPIQFIEEVLVDPESGQPFVLLPAERQFLEYAFKVGPDGRLLYPEQIYSCPKKSGKTAFAAIVTITVTILFGGRFAEGISCANDFDQSVGRVFQAIRRIIECSPLLRSEARMLADKITVAGVTLIAIPTNYASAAGANQTIATFDESWAYTSEFARRLYDEMVPPPTRKIACRLTVTYAGFSNESILLEELYKRGMAQPEVAPCLHAGDGILMFWSHEPVAPWQTNAWLSDMRRSLRPNQYLRMIENCFVTSESSFIELAAWDACVDTDLGRVVNDRSLPVWAAIDASVKHDLTAVVAVTFDRQTQKVRLVAHSVFQPSAKEHMDFETTIEPVLLDLQRRFHVVKVLADPYQMMNSIQRLARAGLPIEEYPQSSPNLTAASQNLYELVTGRNLALYPDAGMRLAVSRAVAIESPRGWRIAKEKQSHKVDVVVALAMACHAAVQDQANAPVIISDDLLHRLASLPKRRSFGSSRSPVSTMMFRTSNSPPADRIGYGASHLAHLARQRN